MSNVLSFVPVSSPVAPAATGSQQSEKAQYPQILSQLISRAVFWQTESQAELYPGAVTEDGKMEKLQLELETLKLFGAGITHDLANVLMVIGGNLELAKLTDRQSELWQTFEELETAVNMANALKTQLNLLFQGVGLVKEPVSLVELIKEATQLALFGARVECGLKLAPNLPLLQVDRCQISQVIENLVLNAVQAIPDEGQIEVAAELLELTEGQVPCLAAGIYVEIKVRDNGIGIAAEQLSLIFAPHFTTKAQGNGLGLALSYAIIKHHKGHITVESQPGVGTTFRLFLPVS